VEANQFGELAVVLDQKEALRGHGFLPVWASVMCSPVAA
jgi:hypothetical protein